MTARRRAGVDDWAFSQDEAFLVVQKSTHTPS
jgi:hypothetical protein